MSGYHKRDLDPFPMHAINRVDRPTTLILDDQVSRVDERESGFNKAARGDFGPFLAKERNRFVMKHPLSGALGQMQVFLRDIVDGVTAAQKAPLPEDPAALSRHIKETAYFLRADAVGICELPPMPSIHIASRRASLSSARTSMPSLFLSIRTTGLPTPRPATTGSAIP